MNSQRKCLNEVKVIRIINKKINNISINSGRGDGKGRNEVNP